VLRRYGQQYAAVPLDLVVELSSEFTPSQVTLQNAAGAARRFPLSTSILSNGKRYVKLKVKATKASPSRAYILALNGEVLRADGDKLLKSLADAK